MIGDSRERLTMWGQYLDRQGHWVVVETLGEGGLELLSDEDFEVIMIDNATRTISGPELCRRVRLVCPRAYVVLVDDQPGQDVEGMTALIHGADDYVFSPLATGILAAKMGALARRIHNLGAITPTVLRCEELEMSISNRKFYVRGNLVALTQREFILLRLFMEQPGVTITRKEIFDRVWGEEWVGDQNVLDVFVRQLRVKIETKTGGRRFINTVRGVGFCFEAPVEAAVFR